MVQSIWRRSAALLGVAMLALVMLSAPASAAQSKPLSAAEAAALLRSTLAALPAPDSPNFPTASSATLRGGAATNAVITCLASSRVLAVQVPELFEIVGQASTSCPVPVDYVASQASIGIWSPDLGRWEPAGPPSSLAFDKPYVEPNKNVTATATVFCRAAMFTVAGFHQARLGRAVATAVTNGTPQTFNICTP